MDKEFWLNSWAENRIGFHESAPHPKLIKFMDRLNVPLKGTVFLPLCGKTVDFDWLITNGYRAVGAEFSHDAIKEVFERNSMLPQIEKQGPLTVYRSENLTLYAGDIFNLSAKAIGPVDGVFDRAALVALPEDTRRTYGAHLSVITNHAPQLLVTFEYDQSQMQGPPFAVLEQEVKTLYDGRYILENLERKPLSGNLAKVIEGFQSTWLMLPR